MTNIQDQFHHRLRVLEENIERIQSAPTLPIYDPTNLQQDDVECQIAIGSDNSFMWFSSGVWHFQTGTPSTIGNVPQDIIEGQIAIGSDGSFHWYVNGAWFTGPYIVATPVNVPQDLLIGQVVIGTDIFCWFIG
jgi:hypothetical protein